MQTKKSTRGTGNPGKVQEVLRSLPGVDRALASAPFRPVIARHGRTLVTGLLREELDGVRAEVRAGRLVPRDLRRRVGLAALARRVDAAASSLLAPSPRPVINATGIVVHTNLGRSLLSQAAAGRVAEAARNYMDLEFDLEHGRRGSRLAHLDSLLSRLFPGYGAVVVNNNAAAIMLALRTLARGKEVVVSRGELVEIGGSFRVPDILSASGARLREVGTTNRTRLADYEAALGPRTGAILKVHTSNFRIVGFTEETTIPDLAGLARGAGVPLVVDWGSGDLAELEPLGIRDEIPIPAILEHGADVVTFSGDKLLGGPQAGFAIGREDLITRMRKNPLARVCRLDRLMICAMRETLASYVRGREFEDIPTLAMIRAEPDDVRRRAARVRRLVARASGAGRRIALVDGVSKTGGGSSPVGERPTVLLEVAARDGDAGGLERALRLGEPPILGRVQSGRLLLDLRTVLPEQEDDLARRLAEELAREA